MFVLNDAEVHNSSDCVPFMLLTKTLDCGSVTVKLTETMFASVTFAVIVTESEDDYTYSDLVDQ